MAGDLQFFPALFEVQVMKCRHSKCSCEVESGQRYCSNECQTETRDEGATECHCGHADCRASKSGHRYSV